MSVAAEELELLLLEICPYLSVMLLPAEIGGAVVRPPNLAAIHLPLLTCFIFLELSFKAVEKILTLKKMLALAQDLDMWW